MDLKQYKKVGAVIAMESEAEPILKAIPLKKIAEKPFVIYNEKNLYVIVSGVGTLSAAMAASYLISVVGCDALVNFGVCGYTGKEAWHGILFSVEKAFKRDVDCTLLGYEKYAYPHESAFLTLPRDEELPACDLYTSDEFIGKESDVPKGVLVDMEGYSVAYAANRYNVPCYLYKSVCDSTDENVDRANYDSKLDGAIVGMEEYINKMFIDYLA